jgi:hypothetical protein
MPDPDIARYACHSRWSDPGTFAAQLDPLPSDPAALPGIVAGLVLHPLFAASGTDRSTAALRSVREIIAAVLARDPGPLAEPREPIRRIAGTCRNHALLACSILRQHRLPARLRVGFADYFTPGFWEDHWVCEYHDGAAWRLVDAELNEETRRRFAIAFDPADVPRDRFLAAGPAWRAMCHARLDPARAGVSVLGIAGLWFAAGSLLRDLAALAREETMPWDYWGPARGFRPGSDIPPEWFARLDRLADALATEPSDLDAAQAILAAHPWAAVTSSVLSFPDGKPVELDLTAA